MRRQCGGQTDFHLLEIQRRKLLKLAGASALNFGLFGSARAAELSAHPERGNVLAPGAALQRLMEGNARYAEGRMKRHDFLADSPARALGQNPFAGILGCADSRVGPDYVFDSSRGELFICHIAGNFADANSVASFEYAVAVLDMPLILVLGHTNCGAVDAAVKAGKDGKETSDHIPSLIRALWPAVKTAQDQPGDLLDNAVRQNVILNVDRLKSAGPILSKAVQEGKLKVVGGIYSLETGRVTLVV
jgi:carbonic anhydrase